MTLAFPDSSIKMKTVTFFFFVFFIVIYLLTPDFIVVDENKIDTLYMVSTIFFSAAIGMVISNNVHLDKKEFKEEIRNMNSSMTVLFTTCFFVETIAYFLYNDSYSHLYGYHIHLMVLGVIIYATMVYVFAMPIISKQIAQIENNDYEEREASDQMAAIKVQQQKILAYCMDKPMSENEMRQLLHIPADEGIAELVDPLLEEGYIIDMRNSFCGTEHVRNTIFQYCQNEAQTVKNLQKRLHIETECLRENLDYMVQQRRLLYDSKKDSYLSFNVESVLAQIIFICNSESKTRYQILKELNLPSGKDGFSVYIKPLLESGKLYRESGTGFGTKYRTVAA